MRFAKFVKWLWILPLFLYIGGSQAYDCPDNYPFEYCPRPSDATHDTICCFINGEFSCCSQTVIGAWAIGVISVACFLSSLFLVFLACCLCPCCWIARRRHQSEYITVASAPSPGIIYSQQVGPPPVYYHPSTTIITSTTTEATKV
ncbi:hypothetical protein HOLleu_19835 [Holothuria leucospilota]|uniref:Uncharacterized protein n=1 Tax=Holothuria leucospilota TaxID=206669 RepID=A0A9Q1H877_HOLLE|nr:hypothetical protein HOLleu_19835 [Holothuria leucospilota]